MPVICIFTAALTVLLILNTRKARGKAYYAVDAPPVSPDTCLLVTVGGWVGGWVGRAPELYL